MQFIPMIDRKSQDVQNGQRDVASHIKDIIEGIDMLSVSGSAKAIPPFKLAPKVVESHVKDIMEGLTWCRYLIVPKNTFL